MTTGDHFLLNVRLNQSYALRRKSSSVHRFQFLLGYFLNSFLAENLLHSQRFLIKNLSLKLNISPIIHLHGKHL